MLFGPTAAQLAMRFASLVRDYVDDGPAERADRARRALLGAVQDHQPATLNEVAAAVGRGAPAVSRGIDTLVRSGLVERTADPDNRRRLAMRLTDAGRAALDKPAGSGEVLARRFDRLAPSELRALERAIEILERSS